MRRKIALSDGNGQELGIRGCILVPVLPLTCVTLGKVLPFPDHSFLIYKIRINIACHVNFIEGGYMKAINVQSILKGYKAIYKCK